MARHSHANPGRELVVLRKADGKPTMDGFRDVLTGVTHTRAWSCYRQPVAEQHAPVADNLCSACFPGTDAEGYGRIPGSVLPGAPSWWYYKDRDDLGDLTPDEHAAVLRLLAEMREDPDGTP